MNGEHSWVDMVYESGFYIGDGSKSDSSPCLFFCTALSGSVSRIAETRAPSVGEQLRSEGG
jgi:hypothetical protein